MAIGERIRFFRNLRGMTQKYLGQVVGFPEKTADIRMAQYESGSRTPKADLTNNLANVFGISTSALTVPDIDSYNGLMHTLFTLEDLYGFRIGKLDDELCIRLDKGMGTNYLTMFDMFSTWQEQAEKLKNGEITKEEYDEFYKAKFNDFEAPQRVMHNTVEGAVSYTSLLFIPSKTPMNYYSQDYKKGLQLYSRGVFIMDHAEDLVPEHFRFVKGLVDSQDLNLNISREMLQHDRKMKVMANKIEKRIQTELENMLKDDRDEYVTFFKNFGMQLKFGIYNSYGMLKDKLQNLLMFYSSDKKELITLKEYVEAMPEDQKEIYFASGETVEKCDLLPQVESVKSKGYDVLYMTDNVDEFCLQMMRDYDSKTFKNVTQGDLDLETEDEKKELEQKTEDNKPLLEIVKKALGDKVQDVKLSHRLKSHPVCLASGDGVSFEMEKVLNQMPDAQGVKAGRILEINPDHDLFKSLQSVYEKEPVKIDEYASILFDQALLIAGFSIDDPVEFSNKITKLMIEASK